MAPLKPTSNGWWDETWNIWGGCIQQSPGCLNCYAQFDAGTLQKKLDKALDRGVTKLKGGRHVFNGVLRVLAPGDPNWSWPLRYKGAKQPLLGPGQPSLIFIGSTAEIFLPERPPEVLNRAMGILASSDHIGLLLTKLPERMSTYILGQSALTQRRWRPKFWLGFSAENQAWFDQRWPAMHGLAEAGWMVFCSIAPMIGPVRLPDDFLALGSWCIASGEQGRHKFCRLMDPRWARSLRDQCAQASLPFFMKQMSAKQAIPPDLWLREFPAVQRAVAKSGR